MELASWEVLKIERIHMTILTGLVHYKHSEESLSHLVFHITETTKSSTS